eukprot:m.1657413 g.1657413  ORF g.1657413 m.1657413 type:complete len:52 (-) comp112247_c0_seq1:58-213(-)
MSHSPSSVRSHVLHATIGTIINLFFVLSIFDNAGNTIASSLSVGSQSIASN